MLKSIAFLLFLIVVSASDTCRRKVNLSPVSNCGPQRTMYNEGECLCCYKDTKNIPTIGIGFNLDRRDATQVMSKYNLQLSKVLEDCEKKTTQTCLTATQAEDIFNTISYPEVGPCVDRYAPGLPPQKRAAVLDVAFAGCGTLNKFVKMQTALQKQNWTEAANQLKDSAWYRQVGPNRCNSDYNCIKG